MKTVLSMAIALLACACAPLPPNGTAAGQPAGFSLKDLPGFTFGADKYKVNPYLAAAAKLQAAGKNKAVDTMRKAGGSSDSTIVLTRMLFTAKPNKEFRRPGIGAAVFLGGTSYKDWPREPIEIVDGVPFVIVRGYALGGFREPDYLLYCVKECDWDSVPFKLRSPDERQKALTKLLASPKWKTALDDEEKAYLSAQIK